MGGGREHRTRYKLARGATVRDWGCVIAAVGSVVWGLLGGSWKGAREGESSADSTRGSSSAFSSFLPIP